ncbi:MAG TPA: hypothetical protein VGK25_09015 [Ignavibacteria bacterium]|jgi:photosystem II stability/assembly factor-like uncharacterized protein
MNNLKLFIPILLSVLSISVNSQTGWVQQNSGTFCNLNSVCFVDANSGYAVGDSGSSRGVILKTSDGGSNWIRQINTTNALSSVMFVDANTGFACGNVSGELSSGNFIQTQKAILVK